MDISLLKINLIITTYLGTAIVLDEFSKTNGVGHCFYKYIIRIRWTLASKLNGIRGGYFSWRDQSY